ncbi:MAG: amino acid adenylation domain-containing protein [Rhodospirillales bacterium]|nr:amino acid adenylation domain-containing protein [Rhodospirillales bacterium]
MTSRNEALYPASANQKRMFVLNQLSPDGTEYNVPVALKLVGKVDTRRLRTALETLVERHASLRTSFKLDGKNVVQKVDKRCKVTLARRQASNKTEVEEVKRDFVRPFDLCCAPLFRACLIRVKSDEYVFLLDMHHIICDGVSIDILLEELAQFYDGQSLKKPQGEYKDFVQWQRRFAKTEEAKDQEKYWHTLLGGDRPTLNLPTDFPRKRTQSFEGDRVFVCPDKKFCTELRSFAASNRVSLYMVLLSAYYVLLSKYSSQEDIIVGTLVAGRGAEEFRDVAGLFVNTLLLRSQPRGDLEFTEYLKQVRGECLDAFENQDYQFEDLVEWISPTRDLGRNPLFDTSFGLLTCDEEPAWYGGVKFSRYELDYEISKFDLSLTAIEQRDQGLALEFEYCTELYRKETIERLSSHYLSILKEVIANPCSKLLDINILTVEEKLAAVNPMVHQAEQEQNSKSVMELFCDQAQKHPAAPAVMFGEKKLTFGDLDKRSNELGVRLQNQGIVHGDLVGVGISPSIEMIVAVLAVLKLGAAYLPIAPTTPIERVKKIVSDSGISMLLIRGDQEHYSSLDLTTMQVDDEARNEGGGALVPSAIKPGDLAYVIYTSGSTGTPKGVMVSHGALANYVTWATKTYVNEEKISFALHSPLSVDLTVTSVFVPLVSGNRIVIYQNEDALGLIKEIVRDNQVQLIKFTPTHLSLLNEVKRKGDRAASKLRGLIVGGEDLTTNLAADIEASFDGQVEIFNEYGPTEACVGCMIHKYHPEKDTCLSVPIGKAIDNTGIFLLNRYGNPVPAGVTGELYVAGAGLAEGYLNNPKLTDDCFVINQVGDAQLRMYKTGDLARMLPNGLIEFLGRNDDQVKIRGYRIELGEIEASLKHLTEVKDAVVLRALDAAGDPYLCAYVVLMNKEVSTADLRTQLTEHFPEYMVPTWFVPLERFPVGRGGKLDKSALPNPSEFMTRNHPYAAPRTKAEAEIAKIWEEVLGLQAVGVDDNFFELGGQSLKATFMIARVNRELRANLSLRDVFTYPVIRELAVLVEQVGDDPLVAIDPVGKQEYYLASSAQKRLFILNQLAPRDVQYNVPWAIKITGQFDAERWEKAFCSLIARHETLRTSFALINDEIVQKVHPHINFEFENRSSKTGVDLSREIASFVQPFDLGKAPLIRGRIIGVSEEEHTLIVDMHHIVSDGISVEIILNELCTLYQGKTLDAIVIQYKDYASWQYENSNTERVKEQGNYWKKTFEGELPILNLPIDFPYGAVQSFEGDLVSFKVDQATVESLRKVSQNCGATMNMTLLAAYTILLSKYADQEDIVVGTPIAGRTHASLQKIVGMFVNPLAMRNQPKGTLSFHDFLHQVRGNALDAYSNQEYQFEDLVNDLEIERNLSRSPLFDTVFAYLDDSNKKIKIDELDIELLDLEWKISKYAVTLLVSEQEQGLACELEFCTKLFRKSTIEKFGTHYTHILQQIARHPDRKINDIKLLTDTERQQILVEFNRTEHPYPKDQSIHELFEKQVAKQPDNIAVVFGKKSLSYLELNQRANQIGRTLLDEGVVKEEIVAIIAEPSIDMIVATLGILKAGCAFLPIDQGCPEDRVKAMLDDSGARIVLETGHGASCQDKSRTILKLYDENLFQGDDSNLRTTVRGKDLAYVIYTSGTTGKPKGVMIEHHSVNNLCTWYNEEFEMTAADRATKYARFNFDASVMEIFPYLQVGAALHILDDEMLLDLPRLNNYFNQNGITISFLPTQVCELFMELDNESLRVLLTGGDRLRRLEPTNYHVVNNYGPTENTVVTTSCRLNAEEEGIPIGRPVFNTHIYLLGQDNKLVPIGIPGELCVAGVGLARGYLNDSVRTDEKFVPNPFEPGTKMYRTGDLAKWLPDGRIEFIGRTDEQVKIRGCRTEPREVETTILAYEAVKDAVVVAREDCQNNNYLCAYIIWHKTEKFAELQSYLAKHLPDYMVPAFLLAVDKFPLNVNGKVDNNALPEPDIALPDGQGQLTARNETEKKLVDLWCEILGRGQVSVQDNFFEIGGHSLRATIMLAKANKIFSTVVALSSVFDNPTIASLALCFEGAVRHEAPVLKQVDNRLYYSTTPIQKLLHAICMSRKGIEYNLPMAFELQGDLDIARLEGVFRQLIERHESLRTSLVKVDGQLMQTVIPVADFTIDILEENDEETLDELVHDFIRPFDLTMVPLMRVALMPKGKDQHILLMDHHHLISDGTSVGILFQEMTALYAGEKLPSLEVTYKDYAKWLGDHLQTEKVRDQERYWLNVFNNPPPTLTLDTDYPNPEKYSFAGGRISFGARPGVQDGLKALCVEKGVTLYMILLAAYNIMLSKYSGQEDIIVGVPTVGRYIADIQDVVGTFVSTHAVRSQPKADLCFDDYLEQVKIAVRGTLENQEYQLWDLMLSYSKETGGESLFSTVFVVQDQAFEAMEIPGLNVEEIDVPYHVSKFDLTLGAIERAAGLEFELEYNTDLFRRSTAKRVAGHFQNILEQLVAEPRKELRHFEVMSPQERGKILHKFNSEVTESGIDQNVVRAFEHQACEFPTRVAMVYEGDIVTYHELNRRSNQLARYLRGEGVGVGDVIGIMVSSSFEMIVGVLAVLKSGASYLPLSENLPLKRIKYFLADSGVKQLLCNSLPDKTQFETPLINLKDEKNYDLDGSDLNSQKEVARVAYVTYAVDQVGGLKKVMVEHRSLFDRCQWYIETFSVTPDDRSAKYSDLTTSATIMELFPFLCVGASICVLPEQIGHNVELLNEHLKNENVTIGWLPAPLCKRLASQVNPTLRVLITAGRNVGAARRGAYELVRCFGPVENTEVTTYCPVRGGDVANIVGKPVTNSKIYIFAHDGGLQPIGVSGEMCIAGSGLAKGNLGGDEAISSEFAPDPYVVGGMMYRTGISARWLADGRIELTGQDREVNVDGHRVYLVEIEQHLQFHKSIKDAVVVFEDDDPLYQRLVAFLVLRGDVQMPYQSFVQELKFHLGQWLPNFMIPEAYVKVGMIPRDAKGSVQYGRLPSPDRQTDRTETSPQHEEKLLPQSTVSETITSIVEDLLDKEQINPAANLFDLGMDSLKAMNLITQINDVFGTSPNVCQVLMNPTILEISHSLSETIHNHILQLNNVAPRASELRLS